MARKAVLLKVQVQTVWAEVDTESGFGLEHVDSSLVIPGAEWSGFYEKWAVDWATLQEQVEAADIDRDKVLTNGHQS